MIREKSFVSLHDCFSHYIHINVVFGLISPPHRKKFGEFYEKQSSAMYILAFENKPLAVRNLQSAGLSPLVAEIMDRVGLPCTVRR